MNKEKKQMKLTEQDRMDAIIPLMVVLDLPIEKLQSLSDEELQRLVRKWM